MCWKGERLTRRVKGWDHLLRFGAAMGLTAMIPDMTIGQLTVEAAERWGEIWDPHATRMTILLLCPRKERKMMELHGDMVEHGQPVMTVFHRPRAEAYLLEEQGFDPRAASFQFVDIATADMGLWLQHLVNNEGWLRNSIELASTPFAVGLPTQRPFEAVQTLCFRHPSLPPLERYFLPFPPDSLPGKCFVSLPRRAAAEMARQQAEVLGVGRLEKPVPEPEPEHAPPAPAPSPAPAPAPAPEPEAPAPPPQPEPEPAAVEESTPPHETASEVETVPLPPSSAPSEPSSEPVPVPLPSDEVETGGEEADVAEPLTSPSEEATTDGNVGLPDVEEDPEPELSEMEVELRGFFQELIDAGVEPSAFMDDPRWEDLNERAIAEGVETWPILLQMTAMG
jgi:hypothetical protein